MKNFFQLCIIAATLVLGLISETIVLAQEPGTLKGKITVNQSGAPLANAEVRLNPGNLGTITDIHGEFMFTGLRPDNYQVTVNHVGYSKFNQTIKISKEKGAYLEIHLQEEIKSLTGIEIIAEPEHFQPYLKSIITGKIIERMPARDVGDFLRSTPNVAGVRKGATNVDPVVRGMKAGQLNVQLNYGHKIEGGCPNRMDPASSHVDVNDISKIEIIKGPYALRYGPAFGGVLNLVTEKAVPSKQFYLKFKAIKGWESNWNGDKEHVTITGGNQHVYFALTGNNQDYGDYSAGNGQVVKSSFKKYNFSGELGICPANHHELKFTFKDSHGRDIRFPALAMDEREDNTQMMSAAYHFNSSEGKIQSVDAKIYRSVVYHEMDNKWRSFSDTVVAISIVDALTTGGRAEFGINLNRAKLLIGIDIEHIFKDGERTKYLILQPEMPIKTEPLWQHAVIRNQGIFAEYRIDHSEKINFTLAGRIDINNASSDPMHLENMNGNPLYHNENVDAEFLNISVSAGVKYRFNDLLSVDLAAGRGVRSPDMVERYIILLPVGYDNYDYLGNPLIKPENNHQADLTVNLNAENFGKLSANLFYSFITDYISGQKVPPSELMPQSAGVLGVKRFTNLDKVHLYGFEVQMNSPLKKRWQVSASVALTAGINPEAVHYIVENGNVTGSEIVKNDPLPEIPPLEVNLKTGYKFFENRFVPQINIRLVAPQNQISQAYDEISTPGFLIAGLNLFYKYNNYLSLSGGINNLFDKTYYEHLNRRIIGSKASMYEPGRIFYLNLILNI